ncbi:MAG: D-glycero-beta-D-manno-heptose 1-phosphate adenylyltransferase [Elusimicrobiota bacterium]
MSDIIFSDIDIFTKELDKVRENKKIVFTNGCFDIIHPGHVHILKKAAAMGEFLVVGLNSDSSVKRLKGQDRPILNERDRAELVSSLKPVDYVMIFSEDTPLNIIKKIRPDVLVKGGEYKNGEIVGENIAKDTRRVKMKYGYSTTSIIEKIRETLC